jgi:hypothetical protein
VRGCFSVTALYVQSRICLPFGIDMSNCQMALVSLSLKLDLLALSCKDSSLDSTNLAGDCDAEVYINRLTKGSTSVFVTLHSKAGGVVSTDLSHLKICAATAFPSFQGHQPRWFQPSHAATPPRYKVDKGSTFVLCLPSHTVCYYLMEII